MNRSHGESAYLVSALALSIAGFCAAAFLPPLDCAAMASPAGRAALAASLAGSMLLHWVALGIAASRQGRSSPGWVASSVLLFPLGSIAALVLLHWLAAKDGMHRSPVHV